MNITRKLGFICLSVIVQLASSLAITNCAGQTSIDKQSDTWPGKKTQWHGYDRFDFEVDGRAAYVVVPKHVAPGKPWVWRARFPDFHAKADLILLERGQHIARINTDGMLGSPRAMKHWDAFYSFVTERGLAKKCALEGVSRGGLFVYGFASRWPDRVNCIYCDTPVCDIRSWPGGKGKGRGHLPTWKACLKEYALTEQMADSFKDNPIDRLQAIAEENIPALHIVSMNDEIVPPTENTLVLAKRYRDLGGSIDIIQVEKGTKNSGGHHFTHPDPLRVADFIERYNNGLYDFMFDGKTSDSATFRGSLNNCRIKFEREKTGRVVFLGGSITTMRNGWRDMTTNYLQRKFPETKFEFIDAGISSTGSTPGAFRLLRDVFSTGDVDLLFEEAAVNDLHNMRTEIETTRGMEGIVRHAHDVNPNLDIILMHFADPKHLADYDSGNIPAVIRKHESVAENYAISSINLAREVYERIKFGQFDWKNDFKNCHPSPYGHRIYAAAIRRLLSQAWAKPISDDDQIEPHSQSARMDPFSYDKAKMISLQSATGLSGFTMIEKCDPRENGVGGSVRGRFHNVPMLVGTKPGDSLRLKFAGRAVGIFVAAGPDAGTIEYSVDGGEFKSLDLFTKWSKGLHIPWVYVLESELESKDHEILVRIAKSRNGQSKGNACRIVNLLVNE